MKHDLTFCDDDQRAFVSTRCESCLLFLKILNVIIDLKFYFTECSIRFEKIRNVKCQNSSISISGSGGGRHGEKNGARRPSNWKRFLLVKLYGFRLSIFKCCACKYIRASLINL